MKLNGTSETDIAKVIVADKSEENLKQLERLFYQWENWGELITNNINKEKEAEIKKSLEARLGKHDRVKGCKWKKSTL